MQPVVKGLIAFSVKTALHIINCEGPQTLRQAAKFEDLAAPGGEINGINYRKIRANVSATVRRHLPAKEAGTTE
jgi:hypothetical protein